MKMKRKEGVDEVSDDFSDFSLSSPARKIRRLDHPLTDVLPPIVEEQDDSHQAYPPPLHYYNHHHTHHYPASTSGGSGSVIIEELPSDTDFDSDLPPALESFDANNSFSTNIQPQDRAIVLFKPVPTPPSYSPSNFSLVSVDSDILSGIKNGQLPWSTKSEFSWEKHAEEQDNGNDSCLAVVPWVPPPHLPPAPAPVVSPQPVEAEEMDVELQDNIANSMDAAAGIQQQVGLADFHSAITNGAPSGTVVFPQWQQQHCMVPHIPQNTCTPITWSQ